MVWSPDEFLSSQFVRRYNRIFTSPKLKDYFLLSSGVNNFPMPRVWKELLNLEIEYDLAYHWYTAPNGFFSLRRAAKVWEAFSASEGNLHSPLLSHAVFMTIGASHAVAGIFDFIAESYNNASALILGLNYPLFERLARQYKIALLEMVNQDKDSSSTLPDVDNVVQFIISQRPELTVIAQPNNPSGEVYTEADLTKIFSAANRTGTLVLVDAVGQLPLSFDPWINVNKVILDTQAQSQVILVNSFSKTDSVPGFRVGYMLVPLKIAQHVFRYQFNSIMNPQTVPVLPIFFSFLARCIFLGEHMGWMKNEDRIGILHFFQNLFQITVAIAPENLLHEVSQILSLEGFNLLYERYVQEQIGNYQSIQQNYGYLLNTLGKYISRHTNLQGGFNCLVEFEPFAGKDEDDVCRELFETTTLAILTESCFRIYRPENRENFWVRISLASPESHFQKAIDRFKRYLDQRTTVRL
ncbi:MAG: pyridoxal phosphate-dependent aminotransferase [Ktedonobacteraceae bacterium]